MTLRLVARYGDANNVDGGFETVKRKEAILLRALRGYRSRSELRSSAQPGLGRSSSAIRGRKRDASSRRSSNATATPKSGLDQPIGTPEDVAESIAPYLEIGYRHVIAYFACAV